MIRFSEMMLCACRSIAVYSSFEIDDQSFFLYIKLLDCPGHVQRVMVVDIMELASEIS